MQHLVKGGIFKKWYFVIFFGIMQFWSLLWGYAVFDLPPAVTHRRLAMKRLCQDYNEPSLPKTNIWWQIPAEDWQRNVSAKTDEELTS